MALGANYKQKGASNARKKQVMEKKQLPKLADLHHDVQTAFKNDELNLLLNQPPHASWIKKHPMTQMSYIPIDKIEFLLTYIFQEWYVEVKEVQQMFQSIAVTVRIYYKNPLNGEWRVTDGVGASPVQTDKGSSAADLGAIKAAAVQMALPSAKSYAIKDACEHIGILFGRDLNRKDTIQFAGAYGNESMVTAQEQPEYKKPTNGQLTQKNTPQPETIPFTFNPNEL